MNLVPWVIASVTQGTRFKELALNTEKEVKNE
jgi:hypothetical protein